MTKKGRPRPIAVPHDQNLISDLIEDEGWCLNMKGALLDKNIVKAVRIGLGTLPKMANCAELQ